MKKILLVLLAVLTFSSMSAQNKGTNQLRVLWVEIEGTNTAAQITGTTTAQSYAGLTQGDWTMGGTVPYPMADDRNALNSCSSLYDNAVPYVVFITPDGLYRSIYGEEDGIYYTDTAICNQKMAALIANYPRSGQAPAISSFSIPATAAANAAANFSVDVISVDAYTVEWTFQDGTPASATGATASCTWATPGTYTVTVTVTNANGTASETGSITIVDFVQFYDFESAGISSWTTIDADGDGQNWGDRQGGHESDACITSASWISTMGPLTPDNWAFSPAITLPNESGLALSWWDVGQDPSYANEHYAVYVCTEATVANATANSPVWEGNSTSSWRNNIVPLNAYAGQTVYLAFRHYNVTDQFMLNIDDIGVIRNYNPAKSVAAPKDAPKATWANIGNPFNTYDFRDTQHQYPISLQSWLDSGFCVVVDYSCCWCGPCWNIHRAGILEGYYHRFGPNWVGPFTPVNTVNNVEVKLYPNPTTGIVNIEAEGIKDIEVMDIAGRTVLTTDKSTFDMSTLANGVYMVRINTESGSTTQKVVKR